MKWNWMNREGKGKPYPTQGVELFFALIWSNLWMLFELNLLFVLVCLPIVTIPAAVSAINRVLLLLIRKGHCFLWSDFWEEFRHSFWRCLWMGALLTIGLAAAYFLLSMGSANRQNLPGMILLVLGILLAAGCCLLWNWSFVLSALLDLPVSALQKDARILTLTEGRANLILLGIDGFCFLLLWMFFPVSILVYLLMLISLVHYCISFLLNASIQHRIILPYEQQHLSG